MMPRPMRCSHHFSPLCHFVWSLSSKADVALPHFTEIRVHVFPDLQSVGTFQSFNIRCCPAWPRRQLVSLISVRFDAARIVSFCNSFTEQCRWIRRTVLARARLLLILSTTKVLQEGDRTCVCQMGNKKKSHVGRLHWSIRSHVMTMGSRNNMEVFDSPAWSNRSDAASMRFAAATCESERTLFCEQCLVSFVVLQQCFLFKIVLVCPWRRCKWHRSITDGKCTVFSFTSFAADVTGEARQS